MRDHAHEWGPSEVMRCIECERELAGLLGDLSRGLQNGASNSALLDIVNRARATHKANTGNIDLGNERSEVQLGLEVSSP